MVTDMLWDIHMDSTMVITLARDLLMRSPKQSLILLATTHMETDML